ncbi:MAG TPA: DUF4367 domain-containing protein [Anaerolineae bacterium]|nr:DUF4367 domain-containing protein [Anaerolineae bacterium]
MDTEDAVFQPRRLALAAVTAMALFVALLFLSPGVQAFAGSLIREIGAIVLIDQRGGGEVPVVDPLPTLMPTAPPTYYAHDDGEISRYAGFEPLTPTYLPEGYSAQGPWSVLQFAESVGVYRQYRDASGGHFLVFNPVKHSADARFEQGYGDNETVTDITVRGQAGVWITGRLFGDSPETLQPTNWLMWVEDGVNYTLYGSELSLAEMVRVAESLK